MHYFLQEKFKALIVERGIEEGTPVTKRPYCEVSSGESKKSTIYGLGKVVTLFYKKPTALTVSTCSTYAPS